MSLPLQLNPAAAIDARRIGPHRIVVVDDFLARPQALVDYAIARRADFRQFPNSYPGPVLELEAHSCEALRRYIRRHMQPHFPFRKGDVRLMTLLSNATLQPAELANLQRICHTDPRPEPGRANFAGLLYLFDDPALGGTAFYRWKEQALIEEATALEMTDPARALAFLRERFPTYNRPPAYMTDSNEIAERIGIVHARFNRWVFYSGDIPHSAAIEKPEKLNSDLRAGRLTLNCFASTRAAGEKR